MTDEPFKMTTRRREVLWHIAYGEPGWQRSTFWMPAKGVVEVWHPVITGMGATHVCQVLRRAGLIRWPVASTRMWITPKGAEELWRLAA